MRKYLPLLLTMTLAAACAEEDDFIKQPPITMPRIYEYYPASCFADCRNFTIYRNETEIELRAYEPDHSFIGLAAAELSDLTNDELNDLIEALESGAQTLGELPGGVPTDGPIIRIYLSNLTLTYSEHHPPTGVIDLDAALAEILDDLSQCRTNIRIDSTSDCEQLAYFPE